jgi:hypothetical protein
MSQRVICTAEPFLELAGMNPIVAEPAFGVGATVCDRDWRREAGVMVRPPLNRRGFPWVDA